MSVTLSDAIKDLKACKKDIEKTQSSDIKLPSGEFAAVEKLFGKLFRGCTLLNNACAWKSPMAGKPGKMKAVRGYQWRLVMAYSGYEQIEDALFPRNNKRRRPPVYDKYIDKLDLSFTLPGPILKGRALKRAEEEDPQGDQLADFLEINKSRREAFMSWLHGAHVSMSEPALAILVFAQLRHLTAHGALSAHRAHELGLDGALKVGPQILSLFAVRIISDWIPSIKSF